MLSSRVYNMERNSSTQRERFFYVYLPIVRAERPIRRILTLKNFHHPFVAIFKFVVDCDLNGKISQIRTKVRIVLQRSFFLENLVFQIKIGKGRKPAIERVSNDTIS